MTKGEPRLPVYNGRTPEELRAIYDGVYSREAYCGCCGDMCIVPKGTTVPRCRPCKQQCHVKMLCQRFPELTRDSA